jgi:hypothetical protein
MLREELEAAERAQGVTVGVGDILLVRTGHAQRLAELGEAAGRWEFLFVAALLRIVGGTGSPLNPIAVL